MAMPAAKFELEIPVQERVARLEANVDHIRSDVSDMKLDIRRLNDKIDGIDAKLTSKIDGIDAKLTSKIDGIDAKLTSKIDGIDAKLTSKIDGIDAKLTGKYDSLNEALAALALRVEKGFSELKVGRALDRVWWLLMSGALLGIMGRAFKWI